MRWGLERCRRQGGVINVVIRVLFNVYVLTRRKRVCVGVGGVGESGTARPLSTWLF